jgi:prepilin-type N-terminal cleavage/methylation domain-containing protein
MKTNRRKQGFTLIELLVVITIIAMLAAGGFAGYSKIMPGVKANSAAKTGRDIHSLLTAWAQDNDQSYPEASQSSNDAFRQLFVARLVDTEKLFAIAGDPWHQNSPSGDGKGPDNDIGTQPDFQQALMPGECAWAYVSALDTASRSDLPLLANAFTEAVGVYTDQKKRKGSVFSGIKNAYVTVGGSARVGELSVDFKCMEKRGPQSVDIFTMQWGTNPDNVRNPLG